MFGARAWPTVWTGGETFACGLRTLGRVSQVPGHEQLDLDLIASNGSWRLSSIPVLTGRYFGLEISVEGRHSLLCPREGTRNEEGLRCRFLIYLQLQLQCASGRISDEITPVVGVQNDLTQVLLNLYFVTLFQQSQNSHLQLWRSILSWRGCYFFEAIICNYVCCLKRSILSLCYTKCFVR